MHDQYKFPPCKWRHLSFQLYVIVMKDLSIEHGVQTQIIELILRQLIFIFFLRFYTTNIKLLIWQINSCWIVNSC